MEISDRKVRKIPGNRGQQQKIVCDISCVPVGIPRALDPLPKPLTIGPAAKCGKAASQDIVRMRCESEQAKRGRFRVSFCDKMTINRYQGSQ